MCPWTDANVTHPPVITTVRADQARTAPASAPVMQRPVPL